MEKMKSLADQIRDELGKPPVKAAEVLPNVRSPSPGKVNRIPAPRAIPDIIKAIAAFDNSVNKNMVHVRFDKKTVDTMNKFKMATGTDISKLVAFAVKQLFEAQPEIKNIIKQFIQNTDL